MVDSRIRGFFCKLPLASRHEELSEQRLGLSDDDLAILSNGFLA